METESQLERIEAKLDAILAALAWIPKGDNAAWYAEQTAAGDKELRQLEMKIK
jgi:hypothetical protein